VKRGKPKAHPDSAHLLVGKWIASDEWRTDVSIVISRRGGAFKVRAIDQSDSEEAEIFGLKTTSRGLSFAAYWSSGQLTKYRLRALAPDQLEAVFTVTSTSTFKRKPRKK
jgi:hypothetical protein